MPKYRVNMKQYASVVVEAADEWEAGEEALRLTEKIGFRGNGWDVEDDGVEEVEEGGEE